MDESTINFYEKNAAYCVDRWDAIQRDDGIAQFFPTAFAAGGNVLDVGCGSGRDLAVLREGGFGAFGVEPVESFRVHMRKHQPELDGFLADGCLPELELPLSWPSTFEGIVCSAVLMHLSLDRLVPAVTRLHELLSPAGRLLLSVPAARPGIVDGRDAGGRMFSGIRAGELETIAGDVGFDTVNAWTEWGDRQGRDGHTWDALLLERTSTSTEA